MSAELELGTRRDRGGEPLRLPARAMLRHMMALGSSGSGKTVLAKVVVEEMVRAGVPALCLDPQGDLCSLALAAEDPEALAAHGVDPELAARFAERCEVVVFTPASDKGVGLGADPLVALQIGAEHGEIDEDRWTRAAATIAALLGYASDDDDGEGVIAVLDTILRELADDGRPPASLRALSETLAELDETGGLSKYGRFLELKKLRQAFRKLARLEVGPRRKLFSAGVPLDIDLLLGRAGPAAARPPAGKVRVAVVHLNSLHAQEDKEFLVAAIAERLYAWMLAHPSSDPQALFYLDEVAPYVPPVRKPQCKDALQLVFKQARKYGVCCLMATQNPGDVDYRAMAQFGTWALGRLTTRQDLKKVAPTIAALAPDRADAVMAELPRLEPGQFVLLSPDHFDAPAKLQARWLLTRHETLDEGRIAELADARWRDRFAELATRSAKAKPKPKPAAKASAPPSEPSPTAEPPAPVEAPAAPSASTPTPAGDTPKPTPAPAAAKPSSASVAQSPAPAAEPEPEPSPPPKPSKAERAAAERDQQLELLRRHGPLEVKAFAELLDCSASKARRALKQLAEDGLAGSFKQGRAAAFWALDTGARPDLGLPDQVQVATPSLGQDQAAVLGQGALQTKLLGSLTGSGPAETLMNVALSHKLLWRVDFEERVETGLLGRIASFGGPGHEDRLGSVYLHPQSLEVLTYTADRGIRFVAADQLRGPASDVHDLDGVLRFARMAPAGLRFDESEWSEARGVDEVRAAFCARWPAQVKAVCPVFLPLWKLIIRRHEPAGVRVALLDAITGHRVDWPRGGEGV